MSTITIEVSDLTALVTDGVATVLAKFGVEVNGEAEVITTAPAPKVTQKPKSNSKARKSATPVKSGPNVRRLAGFKEAGTSTTAASLRKGHVFTLRSNGAMYTVKSVLRTANTVTVSTDHPSVEQMSLPSSKAVTLCYAV